MAGKKQPFKLENWNLTKDVLPPENGDYLVAVMTSARLDNDKKRHVFINNFNADIQKFDFDLTMADKGKKTRIYAWMCIKKPPAKPTEE